MRKILTELFNVELGIRLLSLFCACSSWDCSYWTSGITAVRQPLCPICSFLNTTLLNDLTFIYYFRCAGFFAPDRKGCFVKADEAV
jgi:hypothetical protein